MLTEPEALPAPPPPEAVDTEDLAALRAELARERSLEHGGLIAVILFGIFVFQGLSSGSVQSLIVLVIVLFFHEAGHAAGMLAFGYRDVRIFFLPFFGAAVTGRKDDAAAWQRAIVLLLGPVPGLVLGLILVAVTGGAGILGELGRMAVYVNLFNLLPFEPLDGGRLLGITLFSRSRWLEALFGIGGALGLGLLAYLIRGWVLGYVAVLALLAVRRRFRVASAAGRIQERGLPLSPLPADLPTSTLAAIDAEGAALNPQAAARLPSRAATVREIHDRARFTAPGAGVTLALLTAYGTSVLIGLVALVVAAQSHKTTKAGDADTRTGTGEVR